MKPRQHSTKLQTAVRCLLLCHGPPFLQILLQGHAGDIFLDHCQNAFFFILVQMIDAGDSRDGGCLQLLINTAIINGHILTDADLSRLYMLHEIYAVFLIQICNFMII